MHINRTNLTKPLGLLIAGLSAVCTLQAFAACGTPGTSLKQAYAQGFCSGLPSMPISSPARTQPLLRWWPVTSMRSPRKT